MSYNFYDTCSLLMRANNLFEDKDEKVVISSITLNELENIKTSASKDAELKYSARKLLHTLAEFNNYEVVTFTEDMLEPFVTTAQFSITPDLKILACAYRYAQTYPDTIFVTNDIALQCIAGLFFDIEHLGQVDEKNIDDYSGYKEIAMNNDEMSYFYTNLNTNTQDLLVNQYLILKNEYGEVVDQLCWTGTTHRKVSYNSFNSIMFGEVKPKRDDVYQLLVADSLLHNKITMVKGPAGSGKTYLSLSFLLSQQEKGNIDKIIVFCNTVATKGSAKLGYYPGTRDEKLLDSQIGNLLISKFGGKMAVEQMVMKEKLIILPLSDIRGYDTSGMKAGVYISEAQNMDVSLMKLVLQRIGEDSICIIDGDCNAQVDDIEFAGSNNGMRRASKIFRGEDIYGEVELRTIHRSRIANIAEKM